jgi:hypothetical protein
VGTVRKRSMILRLVLASRKQMQNSAILPNSFCAKIFADEMKLKEVKFGKVKGILPNGLLGGVWSELGRGGYAKDRLCHSYRGGDGVAHLGRGMTWGILMAGPVVMVGVVWQGLKVLVVRMMRRQKVKRARMEPMMSKA